MRLLWAAAIPIQTQARRFLARQHAIKKMCAVLTIQSVSEMFVIPVLTLGISQNCVSTNLLLLLCFSLYDDGTLSVTWKLLYGQPSRFKLYLGAGLLGTAWKTTITVPPKSSVSLEGTSQQCMSLKICTALQSYRVLFVGFLLSM